MFIPRTKMPFRGWTRGDGTRRANAPKHWPFGTVPPKSVVPSTAQPRFKKKDVK